MSACLVTIINHTAEVITVTSDSIYDAQADIIVENKYFPLALLLKTEENYQTLKWIFLMHLQKGKY